MLTSTRWCACPVKCVIACPSLQGKAQSQAAMKDSMAQQLLKVRSALAFHDVCLKWDASDSRAGGGILQGFDKRVGTGLGDGHFYVRGLPGSLLADGVVLYGIMHE